MDEKIPLFVQDESPFPALGHLDAAKKAVAQAEADKKTITKEEMFALLFSMQEDGEVLSSLAACVVQEWIHNNLYYYTYEATIGEQATQTPVGRVVIVHAVTNKNGVAETVIF